MKVFPCSALGGASYIKALKAPFPQIKLMPTGGVSLQNAADYIRAGAGRRYTEDRISGGRTRFTFEAGQTCFRAVDHRVPLDRPEVYTVATAAGTSRHRNGADWVDDFSTHLDHLKTLQQKG